MALEVGSPEGDGGSPEPPKQGGGQVCTEELSLDCCLENERVLVHTGRLLVDIHLLDGGFSLLTGGYLCHIR